MKHNKTGKLLALFLLSAVPAAAGPREDADAGYARKDYKTAAQDFTLAASQGDDVARAQLDARSTRTACAAADISGKLSLLRLRGFRSATAAYHSR
jgi:hypothetical protein